MGPRFPSYVYGGALVGMAEDSSHRGGAEGAPSDPPNVEASTPKEAKQEWAVLRGLKLAFDGASFLGEKIAGALGVHDSRYQYVLDFHEITKVIDGDEPAHSHEVQDSAAGAKV